MDLVLARPCSQSDKETCHWSRHIGVVISHRGGPAGIKGMGG
jgi:hypothetical protein